MSNIRLYVDEDAEQHALVAGLRDRGIDLVTALEADRIGATDREQLDYAIENERLLYSLNVSDFARLHKEYLDAGREHFGIALVPKQRYSVREKIRRLAELVETRSDEEMRNQIAFL